MEALQHAGIELILLLQSYKTPLLDNFFNLVTQFGGFAYVLVMPLIIWCIEPRLGLRALLAMIIAQYIVMLLKDIVQEPRPFLADARVVSDGEHGYSFPSGHAMGSFVFYGMLLLWTNKTWLKVLLALLIFFVGVSRSYLGVHYPHDVVVGWLLGMLFLSLWPWFDTRVLQSLAQSSTATQWSAAFIPATVIGVSHYYIFDYFGALVVMGAVSAGMLCLFYEYNYPSTNAQGSVLQKLGRYVLGLGLTMALLSGFRNLYPAEDAALYNVVMWLNGAVIAAMIGFILPWIFTRLRLSQPL